MLVSGLFESRPIDVKKIKVLLKDQFAGQQILSGTKNLRVKEEKYLGRTMTANTAHEKYFRKNNMN